MAKPIIDIDQFTSPVVVPTDDDEANAASVEAPFQRLANRTHNLNETITQGGLTRQGATRIREVADEAALKVLTGMADGEYAAVASLGGATFRYSATAADAELARWVVKPVVGPGRWINTAFKLVGGPGGLATTKNQIVAQVSTVITIATEAINTTEKALLTTRLPLGTLQANDVIDVVSRVKVYSANGSDRALIGVDLVVDNSAQAYEMGDHAVPPGLHIRSAQVGDEVSLAGRHVVKAGGVCELALFGLLYGSGSWQVQGAGLAATVYRP